MSVYTETIGFESSMVDDPGSSFPYLRITNARQTIKVWKHCRVELFDPMLASEPMSEHQKLRQVMLPSQVPDELWSILTEEERLISSLEQARSEARRLKRTNEILLSVVGVAALVFLTSALLYFP